MSRDRTVTAVLGPTNTGKTHYAIERMLAHRNGIMGFPLRLLAREVYDRVVEVRGPSVVALVTGEERIVPPRAAYWICTVEAMPDMAADFVAVDEIQLCADPDRGYVFTDRLLNTRGLHETLFLGADTMRERIRNLIPEARFIRRERMSKLSFAGVKKTSRMPPRSAVVGFSVDGVYAMAELLRRQKGGAAVVMGALSPRTRNAQVALYQNGDVDHLVATDAIGMGLNLDISHVAFAGTMKFDGRRFRHLQPNELAQIAGRAGRHTNDGTFGTTGEAEPLDPEVAEAIENHRFAPIRRLQWRNPRLEFGTVPALMTSLEQGPKHPDLQRAREADDLATLRALWAMPDMHDKVRQGPEVRLLWDVCQVPDFRKVAPAEHASLLARLHDFLHEGGTIPEDWLARQVARIDKTNGDIDAISKRLAFVRTWTYVAQRKGWLSDPEHWRGETRAVEDRLSDALHAALTQRFVDRRTSVLMRRLKQKEGLVADVNDKGEVSVEGHLVGRLDAFRFHLDPSASAEEAKTLRSAALAALQPHYNLASDKFYNAPDKEIDVTEQGGLMWGEYAVGKLTRGADALSPQVEVFVDDEAGADVAEKVKRRLSHWIDRRVAALFEPLIALRDDEALTGLARGVAYRIVENLGVLPRADVAQDVKSLEQEARALLRKHGVRFGQFTLFQPLLLKPAPTRLRLVLWSLAQGLDEFPEAPPPGLVTVPEVKDAPQGYYAMAGYRLAGQRAIRIDMLERLADMIRGQDTRGGFEANPDMLSITGLTLEQFADLMGGLGYKAERGERTKVKAAPVEEAKPADALDPEAPVVVEPAGESAEPVADATPPDAQPAAAGEPEEVPEPPSEVPPAAPEEAPQPPAETPEDPPAEVPGEMPEEAPGEMPKEATAEVGEAAEAAEDEIEVFYTFTWAPRPRGNQNRGPRREGQGKGDRPQGKGGKPRGKKPGGPKGGGKPQVHSARPPRKEKAIDPDNPFAALMALKDKN
ncbi:helicase-related protein [Pontivivens ytuae]|uniref:Disulfide oxidoreductase n=1 Tax=Pontivivens ytuae TaxID=2789856 RepID=A0A7S9LRJ1_9RHOB|nr:helicase-related protein [Pontivivens ytuae]QPH53430.1 disulfide oxidoreductase [Pontivivens ytuae]